MPERQVLEAMFLDNLELIERIIASVCRRHGLRGDDASELESWIKLRLIEGDYAILGKFRGESSLGTYLTVVIAMLHREYRIQQWGKWRPSAAARRRGPLAIRLETLVHRDGYTLSEAAEVLRTSGETDLSDRALAALLSELPRRRPLRPTSVTAEAAEEARATASADEFVDAGESELERQAAERAMARALEGLSAEDALIVRMRFWDGMSVAHIARSLRLPPKPLYRRIDAALVALRDRLERAGIGAGSARNLLERAKS
ncbi:MAG TPA: sigma-70 family RNA polymerase sigma factor [Gemmatimonadaceae bacterium]